MNSLLRSFSLLVGIFICSAAIANNIQISNASLDTSDPTYYYINFDISWENSWRTNTYESNWDAAWIIVKFTNKNQQDWQHVQLYYNTGDASNDGHSVPGGAEMDVSSDQVGAFLYRSGNGIGNVNYENVRLKWEFGTQITDTDPSIDIAIFATEMVYVPQSAFYLGDGMNDFGQFQDGVSGNPYFVESEAAITLGGGDPGSLGNSNASNQLSADDFDDSIEQSLPAEFPKGYNAFYCMKYEVSQQQYSDFLASLNQDQRSERTEVIYVNNINVYPIATGNHYGVPENPYHAMDYMSWADDAAWADWVGLRPMSELEYEKACRGPLNPVPEEYAWGTNGWYLEGIYTLENEGKADEIISDRIGTDVGNANSVSIYQGWGRPLRCGIFAASAENKTRQETGATYYGIMEMTGNSYERVISVGNVQSRDFSGMHGDGNVTGTGNASFTLLLNWGFVSAIGVGFRNSEISQRYLINDTDDQRNRSFGFRGVRTAE